MKLFSKISKNITDEVLTASKNTENDTDISSKITAITDSVTKLIKKYTLIPIEKVVSGFAALMIAIFVGPALGALGIIAVVRVFNNYVLNRYVWISEATVGVIFFIIGTVLIKLAKRSGT
jgi:hypothetical protein